MYLQSTNIVTHIIYAHVYERFDEFLLASINAIGVKKAHYYLVIVKTINIILQFGTQQLEEYYNIYSEANAQICLHYTS